MAGIAGCGGSPSSTGAPPRGPAGPTISIDNFAFAPASLRVPVGATVTWVNHDVAAHDVKFGSGGIPVSPLLLSNTSSDRWSHTFAKAGTYPYICGIHPQMTGTITVGS